MSNQHDHNVCRAKNAAYMQGMMQTRLQAAAIMALQQTLTEEDFVRNARLSYQKAQALIADGVAFFMDEYAKASPAAPDPSLVKKGGRRG